MLMNSREQSRLQLEGRLMSLQCSCLLPSCIIAPNYPEDFLQHFCTCFCVVQCCQVKQLHAVLKAVQTPTEGSGTGTGGHSGNCLHP